jgi:hypothetical protein
MDTKHAQRTSAAAAAAKPKAAPTPRSAKPSRRSSGAIAKPVRLVCRYCGSDDLAPSFKKRRDARCRACFKKRYGSAAQRKYRARARKAKAAK